MWIEKRHNRYFALHDIPADVKDKLPYGARYFKALETDDKQTAERRKVVLEMRLKGEIEAARRGVKDPSEADAAFWRRQLDAASAPEDREIVLGLLMDETEARAAKAARINGTYSDDEEPEDPEAMRFFKVATGQIVKFTEKLEEWLATLHNEQKTIDMKRSNITKFASRFNDIQDVTKKAVQQWANDLRLSEGKKPQTIQRGLSELRGYWDYLTSLELVAEDHRPFDRIRIPREPQKGSAGDSWRPFTPAEVTALLKAAEDKGNRRLADLIQLGMWTGARIEALCMLKASEVGDGCFTILKDKSQAGQRTVPIHSKLRPIMDRLVQTAGKDGYVIQGLTENKYGDRSGAMVTAFGRLKKDLGFGPLHVFHSIRKTVVTMLENAGVPETVAMDIVGHEKPSMTYGTYSGGNSLTVMRAALESIDYPTTSA